MLSRFFAGLLSLVFVRLTSGRAKVTVENVRLAVREELVNIGLRLVTGTALVFILFYSVIQVGGNFHELMMEVEFGPYYEIAVFSVLGLTSLVALAFLFRSNNKGIVAEKDLPVDTRSTWISPQIADNFMAGFMSGLHGHRFERNRKNFQASAH